MKSFVTFLVLLAATLLRLDAQQPRPGGFPDNETGPTQIGGESISLPRTRNRSTIPPGRSVRTDLSEQSQALRTAPAQRPNINGNVPEVSSDLSPNVNQTYVESPETIAAFNEGYVQGANDSTDDMMYQFEQGEFPWLDIQDAYDIAQFGEFLENEPSNIAQAAPNQSAAPARSSTLRVTSNDSTTVAPPPSRALAAPSRPATVKDNDLSRDLRDALRPFFSAARPVTLQQRYELEQSLARLTSASDSARDFARRLTDDLAKYLPQARKSGSSQEPLVLAVSNALNKPATQTQSLQNVRSALANTGMSRLGIETIACDVYLLSLSRMEPNQHARQ